MMYYTQNINISTHNDAKILARYMGLKTTLGMGVKSIILEGDSHLMIEKIQKVNSIIRITLLKVH